MSHPDGYNSEMTGGNPPNANIKNHLYPQQNL